MKIKHFDKYPFLSELEEAIKEFGKEAEIIDMNYQTIVVNGEDMFTAVASYNEKKTTVE